jgi:hypothetical protein
MFSNRRKPRVSRLSHIEQLEVRTVLTAPTFTSPAAISVAENQTTVETVTATDPDLPAQTLTYSISAGTDASLFSVNSTTGALTFKAAPDFEHPTDAGANNVYNLKIKVDDGNSGTTTQDLAVTVTPVDDNAPVFTSASAFSISETHTAVATVKATDADLPVQALAYTINGGADAALFKVDASTGALSFLTAPVFATPTDAGANNVYNVTVKADDGAGMTTSQDIAVTVNQFTPSTITLATAAGTDYLHKDNALVSPTATFAADSSVTNLAGSKLVVSVSANRHAGDVLGLNEGAGKVRIHGHGVYFHGVEIGTIRGGHGGRDLTITFNSHATSKILNLLVRQIGFTADSHASIGSTRTIQFQLLNLNGTDSNKATRDINVLAPIV